MDVLLGTVLALLPEKKRRDNSRVSYWASSCSLSLPAELFFPESAKAEFVLCHWVEMIPAVEAGIILAL